jgi:hypothetical protein
MTCELRTATGYYEALPCCHPDRPEVQIVLYLKFHAFIYDAVSKGLETLLARHISKSIEMLSKTKLGWLLVDPDDNRAIPRTDCYCLLLATTNCSAGDY